MKGVFFLIFLLTVSVHLLSQVFLPPEELIVEDGWAKIMWEPPSLMKVVDTLNNYSAGDYLAVVSPNWTTWSNLPGSEEDAIITDTLYYWQSAKIENETNLIMEMDTYTSGRFSFYIAFYIPESYSGYFNIQKTNTPGEELGFEIFFGADTTAIINAGGEAVLQFPYWNRWQEFNMIIDLDNDWAEFYFDDYLLIDYQWSLGVSGIPGLNSLGGINISTEVLPGSNDTAIFYVRDMKLRKQSSPEQGLIGYNIYLDGALWEYINSPITTKYYYEGLNVGSTYIAGISSVYNDPIGESEIIWEELEYFPGPIPPFPPENVEAIVQTYNNVTLTWEQPSWSRPDLFGYHIYRNNVFVHRVLGTNILTLQDYPLPADNYEYYMEGIYVSNPDFPWQSNIANCTVNFPEPQNVTALTYEPNILLEWTLPPPELRELLYFNIYRDGEITAESITEYSFLDENMPSGTYTYNVAAVFSGNHESELSEDVTIDHVSLHENLIFHPMIQIYNYPNPFNPTTVISFSIQNDSNVELAIYNVKGQKIKTLIQNEFTKGNHSIVWNGVDETGEAVSSGVYFYKLNVNNKTEVVKKCLLLK